MYKFIFEDSTRTKTSFELAAKRLGIDVINMQIETSSIRKGKFIRYCHDPKRYAATYPSH